MKLLLGFVLCSVVVAFGLENSMVDVGPNCKPELIFDANILLVGDTILMASEASHPIQQEGLTYLLDYCTNFFSTEYGLQTHKWWLGKGPLPPGIPQL